MILVTRYQFLGVLGREGALIRGKAKPKRTRELRLHITLQLEIANMFPVLLVVISMNNERNI